MGETIGCERASRFARWENVGDDKFYAAEKRHAVLYYRGEYFGSLGEANGARSSIIDSGLCQKKGQR